MKKGELCESCGFFNEGCYNVIKCPICGKDVCNFCGNLQVCPACFANYNYKSGNIQIGDNVYVRTIEQGEELSDWIKVN